MKEKKGLIVAIVILVLIVFSLVFYIVYDIKKEKEEIEQKEIILQNTSIDLNAFYHIANTLDCFDKAFNNPKSNYVGYLYVPKKLNASDFDLGAAVYASMIQDMHNTNGTIQYVLESRVKSNFNKIFGKNLTYEVSQVDSGEIYKVAYNSNVSPIRYDYIAPLESNIYAEKYIAVNQKTSLANDKVIVNRKIFFVEFVLDSAGNAKQANIYKNHTKGNKIGTISLKNGEINTNEVISKYGSKLLGYDYTFIRVKDDNYSFSSIELTK